MNEDSIREAVARADQADGYAAAVHILLAAGVTRYHTDVRAHTLTYSSDAASYIDRGEPVAPVDEPPRPSLDVDALIAAKRAIDEKRTDYHGFLHGIWKAGVVEYDVDLLAGTITYRGNGGGTHVESVQAPGHEETLE